MTNLIKIIRDLVKQNKLNEALLNLDKLISQSDYKNASTLYKRELTELDKNYILGLSSIAEVALLKTNISNKILEIVSVFEKLESSEQNQIEEIDALKINSLIVEVNGFNSTSIKVYKDRFEINYLETLIDLLTISPNNLVKKSIELPKEVKIGNKVYTRAIKIYFNGISATTLFDIGGNFGTGKVAKVFKDLLDKIDSINEQGVLLELRTLFVYPYSDFSISLLQAEHSKNRPVIIDNNRYIPTFNFEEPLEDTIVSHSDSHDYLIRTLKAIRGFLLTNKFNDKKSPNRILVKFTPQSPNHCSMIINNDSFTDYYSYSKREREKKKLPYKTPLLHINKLEDQESFECIENHFMFLWYDETTIFFDDALDFNIKDKKGHIRVKKPNEITYAAKAKWIKKYDKNRTENYIKGWQFVMSQKLCNMAKLTQVPLAIEKLFIVASWEMDSDGNKKPNLYAQKLEKALKADFSSNNTNQNFDVKLINTENFEKEGFPDNVFKNINESSLAIVVLTKNEKDNKYTKPNLYLELGYLLKQFGYKNNEKILLLVEEGVEKPNLVSSIHHHRFNKENHRLHYLTVLKWLKENSRTITNSEFKISGNKYLEKTFSSSVKLKLDLSNALNNIKNWIIDIK